MLIGPNGEYLPNWTIRTDVTIGKIVLSELNDTTEAVKNSKP